MAELLPKEATKGGKFISIEKSNVFTIKYLKQKCDNHWIWLSRDMKNYFLDNTLVLSDVPNGPFAEYGHMVQKAPRWMANEAEGQEKRDYISQKANILFLRGPNVSITIQQDAFCTKWPYSAKGPFSKVRIWLVNNLLLGWSFIYRHKPRNKLQIIYWVVPF